MYQVKEPVVLKNVIIELTWSFDKEELVVRLCFSKIIKPPFLE